MQFRLFTLFKGSQSQVKQHMRQGKVVAAHARTNTRTATVDDMKWIQKQIEGNTGLLIKIGKEVAASHGLPQQFYQGKPTGDLEDVVAEGRHGMIIGAMEAMNAGKKKDDIKAQMRSRARQRMRDVAKKLMGAVDLPHQVTRDLAILVQAKERFRQTHDGREPAISDLSKIVVLDHRDRNGNKKRLNPEQTIDRIHDLEQWAKFQQPEDLDTAEELNPYSDEADVDFWNRWDIRQRELRDITHQALNKMVKDGDLSIGEKNVMFWRFYVDKPEEHHNERTRTFDQIARLFDANQGLKKIDRRKQVGDQYRFTPTKKIRTVVPVNDPKNPRKKSEVVYTYEPFKDPVTAKISKINKDNFIVARGKKSWEIPGKPPEVSAGTTKQDVQRLYESGVAKIQKDPDAPAILKEALDRLEKSMDLDEQIFSVFEKGMLEQQQKPKRIRIVIPRRLPKPAAFL